MPTRNKKSKKKSKSTSRKAKIAKKVSKKKVLKKKISKKKVVRTKKSLSALFGKVFQKGNEIIYRRVPGGSLILMDLRNEAHYFSLDGLSAEYWELLDGKSDCKKLAEKLIAKHGLPREAFLKDVEKLVLKLKKNDLISQV